MFMKYTPLVALLLLLPACTPDTGGPVLDSRKFLEQFKGPDVPTMKDALLENAQAAEKRGNLAQAATFYEQALEKRPNDPELLSAYGDLLRRSGQYDKALFAFERALANDAGYAAALEGKGLTEMAKGSFDSAADTLAQAFKADPKRWRTLNGLGILFSRKGLYPEAQQYFSEAISQSPGNPSVLNNSGLAKALDRDYAGAKTSLLQASRLTESGSNERKQIELNMALVHAISGHLQEARDIAAKYFTGPALDNNMGVYAYLAKDETLAKTYLNMALSESKTYYARAWENLETLQSPQQTAPSNSKTIKIAPKADEVTPAAVPTTNPFSSPFSAPADSVQETAPVNIAPEVVEEKPAEEKLEKRRPAMQDIGGDDDLRMLPQVVVQPPVDAIGDSDMPASDEVVLGGENGDAASDEISTDAAPVELQDASGENADSTADSEKSDEATPDDDSDAVSRFLKDIFKQ